jgi:hypothetical protein
VDEVARGLLLGGQDPFDDELRAAKPDSPPRL